MTVTKRKIDIWPTVAGILLVIMVGTFIYSSMNSHGFKKEIKVLKVEKDSLQAILNKRQQVIDSLKNIVIFEPQLFDTIQFREQILNKIKKQYENRFNSIDCNDVDSNIELLTKFLSEKADNR